MHNLFLNKQKAVDLRTMFLSCLIVFLAQMSTTVYLPSLPIVMQSLNLDRNTVELSISLFVIGAAAPVLFFGIAADYFGRKKPLIFSLFIFIVCSSFLFFATTKIELLTFRFFQGIGAGRSAIIARIIVRDRWTGNDLARKLSILSMAFITALGGGQFIGGLIGKFSSWEVGFATMALTGIFSFLLSLTVPMLQTNKPQTNRMIIRNYLNLLREVNFMIPACVGGFGFATTVTLQQVSPFIFQDHFALSVAEYGNIGLLIGCAYFLGALLVNHTVIKIGRHNLLISGAVLAFISSAGILIFQSIGLLTNSKGLIIFIFFYCVIIFGQAVLFPNSMAIAVTSTRHSGAYAMALCGFLQQSIAGIAASILTSANHVTTQEMIWPFFIILLSSIALMFARKSLLVESV